jgi:hypothetical protein
VLHQASVSMLLHKSVHWIERNGELSWFRHDFAWF